MECHLSLINVLFHSDSGVHLNFFLHSVKNIFPLSARPLGKRAWNLLYPAATLYLNINPHWKWLNQKCQWLLFLVCFKCFPWLSFSSLPCSSLLIRYTKVHKMASLRNKMFGRKKKKRHINCSSVAVKRLKGPEAILLLLAWLKRLGCFDSWTKWNKCTICQ